MCIFVTYENRVNFIHSLFYIPIKPCFFIKIWHNFSPFIFFPLIFPITSQIVLFQIHGFIFLILHACVCVCVHMHIHAHMCACTYREKERDRENKYDIIIPLSFALYVYGFRADYLVLHDLLGDSPRERNTSSTLSISQSTCNSFSMSVPLWCFPLLC